VILYRGQHPRQIDEHQQKNEQHKYVKANNTPNKSEEENIKENNLEFEEWMYIKTPYSLQVKYRNGQVMCKIRNNTQEWLQKWIIPNID
jgi:hypothetical protein